MAVGKRWPVSDIDDNGGCA
ncbi:uncharacterized protein G2W53_041376 [Senna tora]|uniref:Uncharacterized protein n=1 Tax=Senna tora TaxID=362788 RepID=A0A834VZ43_9FABA|nr:uncharacterized protein G2W53_041376 [Senna tora]